MLPFLHLSKAQNIYHFRLKLNLVRNNFSLYCLELKTYWIDPLRKFSSLYLCVFQTVSASLGNETIFIIVIKQQSVDFKLRKLLLEWLNTSANTINPSKFNIQINHMLEQVHTFHNFSHVSLLTLISVLVFCSVFIEQVCTSEF